ncbi:hypothetical protein Poli38472_011981 [Pythium oligandrum]|uniref:Uncharacterized protein n=1 Tax=Pythium oligandrum TaxID=41045 RepID=A0A8K1CP09_PYTOL|nr:hypothetical protein Poli38472_011981 [Pythium oligandrum]|eukprot:TMW66865.1 hypothetical protein Poli38472_011981 [Pythium oligandrum]
MKHGVWSQEEHDRFLEAIKLYPEGPWRLITQHVGTRSVRQVQTHAQKYHEKIARRMRGLRKERTKWARLEHRIEDDLLQMCKQAEGFGVFAGTSPRTPVPIERARIEPVIKAEPEVVMHVKAEPFTDAYYDPASFDAVVHSHHLPTLDESLDFFIECLSE